MLGTCRGVQKGDYYEAVAWKALELAFNRPVVYEPDILVENGVHTKPDFFVDLKIPTYVHVCYWSAKETSHAKFWRTVSEIADIKCRLGKTRNMCIIFESSYDGEYFSNGWYPEFLHAFDILFDDAVFFSHENLIDSYERSARNLGKKIGTRTFYEKIKKDEIVESLARLIRKKRKKNGGMIEKLWEMERREFKNLSPYDIVENDGYFLRNSILQIVLLMGLLKLNAKDTIDTLKKISRRSIEFPYREEIIDILCKLPIAIKDKRYKYIASEKRQGLAGPFYCTLNEELNWFLHAYMNESLPTDNVSIIDTIEKIFEKSSQKEWFKENVESIREELFCTDVKKASDWKIEKWYELYTSVDKKSRYNRYAEMLIASTKMGIYQLITEINKRLESKKITRTDIRSLYSNAQGKDTEKKRRLLIRTLAEISHERKDAVSSEYIHRKVARIVGAQSAVNPLEELVCSIVNRHRLGRDVEFIKNPQNIPTLISDLTKSSKLGFWKVKISFKKKDELIPLFISAMKEPADCAHKADEFSAHLRFAKYRISNGKILPSGIKRGIAVLEGSYSHKDKIALHNAGYHVCSLSTLPKVLFKIGLVYL